VTQSTTDTLLLDMVQQQSKIFQQLGSIDAQLASGLRTHQELKAGIAALDTKVDNVEKAVASVETTTKGMKPIVDDYQANRNKAAGILLFITALASGLGYFASEIKAVFFGRH
jgi:flagellin-like hook-associated protein FlgL